jgi:hypothetical protein
MVRGNRVDITDVAMLALAPLILRGSHMDGSPEFLIPEGFSNALQGFSLSKVLAWEH